MKDVYKSFVSEYPIVSVEDPFDQDDWTHYAKLTEEIGEQVQIVGDDLLVTNPTVNISIGLHGAFGGSFLCHNSNLSPNISAACCQGNQRKDMQCSPFEGKIRMPQFFC